MEYSEKLKDPRWQKKRLEVFNRDAWTCQKCYDDRGTLHAHHLNYRKGADPWDYDNEDLLTLCEECHQEEKDLKRSCNILSVEIRRKFKIGRNIEELAEAFASMKVPHTAEVFTSALCELLTDEEKLKELIVDFFENLKKKEVNG